MWDSLITSLAGVIVGFALAEWSARREWHRQLEHRWDVDRRRAYAAYLTAVDGLHGALRDIKRFEQELEDTGAALVEVLGIDPSSEARFSEQVAVFADFIRGELETAQGRRAELRRRVDELKVELDLLTTKVARVLVVGLEIYAGDEDEYRERRKEYLERVRKELRIRDWPQLGKPLPVRLWRSLRRRMNASQ